MTHHYDNRVNVRGTAGMPVAEVNMVLKEKDGVGCRVVQGFANLHCGVKVIGKHDASIFPALPVVKAAPHHLLIMCDIIPELRTSASGYRYGVTRSRKPHWCQLQREGGVGGRGGGAIAPNCTWRVVWRAPLVPMQKVWNRLSEPVPVQTPRASRCLLSPLKGFGRCQWGQMRHAPSRGRTARPANCLVGCLKQRCTALRHPSKKKARTVMTVRNVKRKKGQN